VSSELEPELARLASGFSGIAGVCAIHLGTDERVAVLADETFPTASAIKLFVLCELERRGERELRERVRLEDADRVLGSGVLAHLGAGLEPTLGDLGVLMMMVSDNTAANLLIDRLGLPTINATMRAAGLERTELRGRIDFAALAPTRARSASRPPASSRASSCGCDAGSSSRQVLPRAPRLALAVPLGKRHAGHPVVLTPPPPPRRPPRSFFALPRPGSDHARARSAARTRARAP
jgi:hypothetical protein